MAAAYSSVNGCELLRGYSLSVSGKAYLSLVIFHFLVFGSENTLLMAHRVIEQQMENEKWKMTNDK